MRTNLTGNPVRFDKKWILMENRNKYLALVLSLLIPGLGQIYAHDNRRGAAILIAVIIVGNLNAIFLPVFVIAHPDHSVFWAFRLPIIIHDVMAFYGIVFWIWQTIDAWHVCKKYSFNLLKSSMKVSIFSNEH